MSMAKKSSPSSSAVKAVKAFVESASVLKREERIESLIISLYAKREDARQDLVEILKESIVVLEDSLSIPQIGILNNEYEKVIRYCYDTIINSGVKSNRTIRIPEELVDFCIKAIEIEDGAHILLPYSENAEFAFALHNCNCRGFASSQYRWAFMQIVLDAFKNPADIRFIGDMDGSDEEKNENVVYDYMFSMPPMVSGNSAFSASFILQMVEQNFLKKGGTVCLILPVESTTEHEWLAFRDILVRNPITYDVNVVFMPALLRPLIDKEICVWFITRREDNGGHILLSDVRSDRFFYDDEVSERYIMKTASILESISIGEKGVVEEISNTGLDSEKRFRVPSLLSMDAMPSLLRTYTYEEGYKVIKSAINSLRGIISDYKVVLYLLHYYRKGLFDSYYSGDTPDSFIQSRVFSDFEHRLYQVFSSSLSVFRDHRTEFERFLVCLGELDDSWFNKYGSRLFDELLTFIQSVEGKSHGEFTQPLELTKFVAAISGYDGKGTLYNPFAGSASYCTELAGSGRFVAQEINQTAWAIGVLRLMSCGMDPSSYYNEDSLTQWRGLSGNDDMAQKYDCIVATPPLGLRVRDLNTPWAFGNFSLGEDVYIWNCLASVAVSGIALGVFSPSVAFRGDKSLELRQRYVDSDILDTVVTLPGGVFPSTSIAPVILKFNPHKDKPGFVRLVDGSSFSVKEKGRTYVQYDKLLGAIRDEDKHFVKYVSLEEIREKEYNITPRLFFKESVQVPEGFERKKLIDLVEFVSGTSPRPEETKGKVVSVGSLSDTPFNSSLNIGLLQEEEILRNFRKITSPVLLLSKVRTLKPTFAEASREEPIFINSNILAAKIKDGENIYVPELIRVLSKVKDFQTGTFVPSISIGAIKAIEIILPKDYSIQEALYLDAEREYKLARVREYGLEEMLATQKNDFILLLRNRKHDINTYVADIRNRIHGLEKYLKKRDVVKEIYSRRQNKTVGDNLDAIISSIDLMGQYLEHIADENKYCEPEKVDLFEKLSSIPDGQNYTVLFEPDLTSLHLNDEDDEKVHAYVSISPIDLDRVRLNIVSNARKHGFIDPTISDYKIVISLFYNYETNEYVVEFKNNGKPMSEGLDTSRYGTDGAKFGATKGDGHGGAIVKDTIEHFGGSIEVINEPQAPFPVGIIIRLPRYDGE